MEQNKQNKGVDTRQVFSSCYQFIKKDSGLLISSKWRVVMQIILGDPLGAQGPWLGNTFLFIHCNIAKLTVNDSTLHSNFMVANIVKLDAYTWTKLLLLFNCDTSLG